MSLIVNGTEIENVIYNGTELTELVFNGVKVWEKSTATAGLIYSPASETGAQYYVTTKTVYAEADAITYYAYDFNTNTFVAQTLTEGASVVGLYQANSGVYSYYGVLDYVGTDTDVVIPNQVNGNVIQTISPSAFANTSVTSVKWGENMQYIYFNAFNNTPIYNNSSNWENGCLKVYNAYVVANSTTITIPEYIEILGINLCYYVDITNTGLTVYYNSDKIKNLTSYGAFKSNVKGNGAIPASTITFGSNITRIPSYLFVSGQTATSSSYINKEFKISSLPSTITKLEMYSLNCSRYAEQTFNSTETSPFIIPATITDVSGFACTDMYVEYIKINLSKIPMNMFNWTASSVTDPLKVLTIGANCSEIGNSAFAGRGNSSSSVVRFEQPSGMAVTLPTAGSSTGMFYEKTARTITVYTDNETIKNYAWATDNKTVTFYHLDGSAWA